MIIKVSMIIMLIAALFFPGLYHDNTAANIPPANADWKLYLQSFGLSLVAVSFTYGGYQQTINFGHEVNNASRNIPRGIFIGIAAIILLYLTVNYSYYKVVGFENLKSTNEIATVIAFKLFGGDGANVFSGLLFLSVLAYVNVQLMSNPRVMFAMSEDGVLPAVFKKKSAQRDVAVTSLTVFSIICIIVLFFAKTFDEILSFTIFLDCFGMALSAGSIFMLRKRTKHLDGTGIYSMRLYPLQPIIFIAAYVFVCLCIIITKPMTALIGISVLSGFMLLYFLMPKNNRTKAGT
jgi:APA family basic amino acid/polyamine antiporter